MRASTAVHAALAVSVLGNVFLVGALVGGALAGGRPGPQLGGVAIESRYDRGGLTPGVYLRALPQEELRAFGQVLRAAGEEAREARREVIRARLALRAALEAEPFEADAVETAMTRAREAEAALRQEGDTVLLALMAQSTPEARRAALEEIAEQSDHRRGRGRGRGEDDWERRDPKGPRFDGRSDDDDEDDRGRP